MSRIWSAGLAFALLSMVAMAAEKSLAPTAPVLRTEFAFTVRASLSPPLVVGNAPNGLRRFVPIVGGTFSGPLLNGKVIAGSGDWQIVRSDGVLEVEARYTLETNDGVLIVVSNRGIRQASPEIMAKLTRGESVPADSYYFRTIATFEAPVDSKYAWVNRTMFAATAEREPNAAIIHFFRIL
jgi:hypothetical protein